MEEGEGGGEIRRVLCPFVRLIDPSSLSSPLLLLPLLLPFLFFLTPFLSSLSSFLSQNFFLSSPFLFPSLYPSLFLSPSETEKKGWEGKRGEGNEKNQDEEDRGN